MRSAGVRTGLGYIDGEADGDVERGGGDKLRVEREERVLRRSFSSALGEEVNDYLTLLATGVDRQDPQIHALPHPSPEGDNNN